MRSQVNLEALSPLLLPLGLAPLRFYCGAIALALPWAQPLHSGDRLHLARVRIDVRRCVAQAGANVDAAPPSLPADVGAHEKVPPLGQDSGEEASPPSVSALLPPPGNPAAEVSSAGGTNVRNSEPAESGSHVPRVPMASLPKLGRERSRSVDDGRSCRTKLYEGLHDTLRTFVAEFGR